jgi:cell division protein FtsB
VTPLAANAPTTLLGVAAIISAIAGVGSTIMAVRKSRNEEEEHLRDELAESRANEERLAKELHDLKMGRLEDES